MSIFLSFDWKLDVDRLFFLAQRPTQLRQCNVLQLTNAFARHAVFLADFFEGLWLSAVETESLEDDFLLAIVEHVEQSTDFVTQIFVPQKLEWRLRFFVANDFAELGGIVVADRRVEGSRPNRNCLQLRDFARRDSDFFAKLVIGRFAAELFAHLQ